MSDYLGKIIVAPWGKKVQALLDEKLVWHCPASRVLRDYLRANFSGYSPADGIPGRKLLHDAAEALKGKAMWLDRRPAEMGAKVY